MSRVYLDHNATTPLRSEARDAMLNAMDVVGNPSSVHAEGREGKALVEGARARVAELVGCKANQVIFTSSATEAAALVVAQKNRHGGRFVALPTEHDCLGDWTDADLPSLFDRYGNLDAQGASGLTNLILEPVQSEWQADWQDVALVACSAANSETGIMLPEERVASDNRFNALIGGTVPCATVCDITQMAGKVPVAFASDPHVLGRPDRPSYMILSAHKLGGPKGVGALINFTSDDPTAILRGGGQEMGRRSGTENVIGIAGFGAAAQAAHRDVTCGAWARVEKLRNILEKTIAETSIDTIFVGKDVPRLPNTSCMITPGWKGETQVMQMDLSGFAISAGSACSSGKVKSSTVLRAMGYSEVEASSAIRVSLGLETTEEEVMRFAYVWSEKFRKFKARAA